MSVSQVKLTWNQGSCEIASWMESVGNVFIVSSLLEKCDDSLSGKCMKEPPPLPILVVPLTVDAIICFTLLFLSDYCKSLSNRDIQYCSQMDFVVYRRCRSLGWFVFWFLPTKTLRLTINVLLLRGRHSMCLLLKALWNRETAEEAFVRVNDLW